MKSMRMLAAFAAMSVAAQATPAAAAELVTNGGFETGDLTGWNVTGNHEGAAGDFSGYTPHSGNDFAYLGDTSGTGSLSQLLTTAAGQTYTLSYYLASHGDNSTTFSALWNGQTIAGSELVNPNSNGIYTLFSFLVTGTGSDTLTLLATDPPSYLALDDVSVTEATGAVPEPATWAMMLLGFVGIGAAVRRNRKPAGLAQIA